MTTVAARNAAFLAFAIELKHEAFIYTTEFVRALDAALEAAAPHMCDGSSSCASPAHIEGCFSTNPDYARPAP